MSNEPKFGVGDDLYVRDPARIIEGAVSITGPVSDASRQGDGSWIYTLDAHIARKGSGETCPGLRFAERDLGLRLGTPLSQLSGRPGHPGYAEFKRIAASWGYD